VIKQPTISVVIPVYNVEQYLRETLDSIVDQNINFKKNVELILVNDGSSDGSEDVCLEYKRQFPNNIIYHRQKNQGVSAARNKGLSLAHGQYVHFMDSDDIASRNFYHKATQFLDSHKSVDLVAAKIMLFEAEYSPHYLNGKFRKLRVIDIDKEPEASIFHVSSCIFRRQAVAGHKFDRRVPITEDTKFLLDILHKRRAYGVLPRAVTHNYRKRHNATSAINQKINNRGYFLDVPKLVYDHIISQWRDSNGRLARFAQYELMNDIRWRIVEGKQQSVLGKSEETKYKKTIYDVVKQIDDDIIINSYLSPVQKSFLLRKKHGHSYEEKLTFDGKVYYFGTKRLLDVGAGRDGSALVLDFIRDIGDGKFKLEGYVVNGAVSKYDKYFIKTSLGCFPLKNVPRAQRRDGFLGDVFSTKEAFEVEIKVNSSDRIIGQLITKDGIKATLPLFTKRFTGLSDLPYAYRRAGALLLTNRRGIMSVNPRSWWRAALYELRFMLRIALNLRPRRALGLLRDALRSNLRMMPRRMAIIELAKPILIVIRAFFYNILDIFFYRTLYHITKYRIKKPIWLVSDRGTMAGDNGEALFTYIMEHEKPEAKIYFVISKKSPDYRRLKKVGKVLNIKSPQYKLLFLLSSKIISSHADDYVVNPFGYRWNHFCDLFNFDFVFLQHGITKDDISGWLNRFNKNIKIFITGARPEYDSILSNPFYYTKENVVLSGFPRYDLLSSQPTGKLMLAPTWRDYLLKQTHNDVGGLRAYSDNFRETNYYKFYNSLMNDERVLEALRDANMIGELYLHPAFSLQARDFQANANFVVKTVPYSYRDAFRDSNLLVTDYSSVPFDFAYLKKPIIYTQFDKLEFYQNHIYNQSYYSYEKDGFGPVVYNHETAVKLIVQTIKNGCKVSQKYQARVDTFFAFRDRENSKRVYQAILRLE
jgi:CDP-glycerol glycerophosphotransferase (TagB/SpsB family)/glycosyltransferase involved in cell wall biosynthesis